MANKRRVARPRRAKGPRGLGTLAIWVLIAGVTGAAAFLVVYAATSGGDGKDDFTAQVVETPSDLSLGEPFQGGPRLYLPVETVDLGQVPFHKEVSHAFDLRNVGDAPLKVEDVQVTMLEGC